MEKKALIIGVSGQDGAYLAELLLDKGYEVHGTSRNHKTTLFENLLELGVREQVIKHSLQLDSLDQIREVLQLVKPEEVYNLSGQTSVGLSFERPLETFQSIAGGTINILEAIRLEKSSVRFFNAGSGEMYGETLVPAKEETPVNPISPYGVAKAAAFHQVKIYRENYGVFSATGILFNHESPLRPERFVTQKIVKAAVRIANGSGERLKLGNLDIYRDWGWAPDYVDAMWRTLQHMEPKDFVIATGKKNSLREFVENIFEMVGLNPWDHVDTDASLLRSSDIFNSFGCPIKAYNILGWKSKYSLVDLIKKLI